MKGTNYYKVKAIVDGVESGYSSSVAGSLADNGLESGIYLGITGFNDELYNYPVMQISKSSIDGYYNFIDGLTMKFGTVLYYSVDQAINTLQAAQLPSDLSTAAIVTFTDGLDQGSPMLDDTHDGDMGYLNDINQRIKNETVLGKSITAYSIGLKGSDVKDEDMFQTTLKKLASTDANAFKVNSMSEVNAKFKEIAGQLSQSNYIQTINLKIPGLANGTIIRFTFDNVKDAVKSNLYIEGTFNLSARALENVKYVGMTSTSGSTIKGTQNGIFVTFAFEGVHTDNNVLIDSKFTDEWTYIASNHSWQINSEFDKTESSDIVTERSSAVIMLVLDCSGSLAGDFVTAQSNAKDFINTLYEAVGGDSGFGEKPGEGNDNTDNTIYSTTPKDLTLAIWKDGKRYYLTKEDYDKASLSDAIIEGLTIVAGGESFILSLKNVQSNYIDIVDVAMNLYGDIMPTAEQGVIISAKWDDIQSALIKFGGDQLRYYYYTSSTTLDRDFGWDCYTNCIHTWGGSLNSDYVEDNYYNRDNNPPYIRGAKSTNHRSAIYWTDPNDLKLSVVINGNREFLNVQEYNEKKESIATIEGIAIIAGGEKFAIHLNNAQSGAISSVQTAMKLYGDIMPTAAQGVIILAKWHDIESALSKFGGDQLEGRYYYTSSTTLDRDLGSLDDDYTNCIYYWKGGCSLSETYRAPYIRGVTNFE